MPPGAVWPVGARCRVVLGYTDMSALRGGEVKRSLRKGVRARQSRVDRLPVLSGRDVGERPEDRRRVGRISFLLRGAHPATTPGES